MLVVEAGADLAAAQGQRGDVALQVVSVFVEEQLVVLQAAPALPPAIVGQNVQVTCRGQTPISLAALVRSDQDSCLHFLTTSGHVLLR